MRNSCATPFSPVSGHLFVSEGRPEPLSWPWRVWQGYQTTVQHARPGLRDLCNTPQCSNAAVDNEWRKLQDSTSLPRSGADCQLYMIGSHVPQHLARHEILLMLKYDSDSIREIIHRLSGNLHAHIKLLPCLVKARI